MASHRRKSEADAGRDAISEVPVEVKERILECLPTRDAAKTALLSTHWNEIWLRHGRLVFDKDFFECLGEKDTSEDVNSWRKELLCFPRSSPKAQLVCTENDDYLVGLFDYMWF
nr:F-box/FBD/LRR-repeat protein At1g13570-like [Ipomoea trifida]